MDRLLKVIALCALLAFGSFLASRLASPRGTTVSLPASTTVQPPSPPATPTSTAVAAVLRVRIVHAEKGAEGTAAPIYMDPRLSEVAKYLARHKGTSFRLISDGAFGLVPGATSTIAIPPGGSLDVRLKSPPTDRASFNLELRIDGRSVIQATVGLPRNKPVFVVGSRYGNGVQPFLLLEAAW